MAIPKYTSYEIMQTAGITLQAVTEQITKLEKAPNSEALQDYYVGMKDGAKLLVSTLKKTLDSIEDMKGDK